MISPTQNTPWKARVITLFPELFPGPLGCSLVGKALNNQQWALETIDLRKFGLGNHRIVDDKPFGGGPGMVFRPDVVESALNAATQENFNTADWPLICLTPRGKKLNQSDSQKWAKCHGITILCGRFEGIDERVIEHYSLTEVSVGDFVLSGGEIAAYALIDSVVRLIPKILGNQHSVIEESHHDNLLEYPQYTQPRIWNGVSVPKILLSGNHAEIAKWRKSESIRATRIRRPDMWNDFLQSRQ